MNRDLLGPDRALESVLRSQFRSLRRIEKSRQYTGPSNLQSGFGITDDLTRVGMASPFTWENVLSSGANVPLDRGRWLLIAAVNFAPGTSSGAFDVGLRIVTPSATREVTIQGNFDLPVRFSPNVALAVTEDEAFDVQVQGGFRCNTSGAQMFFGTDILMTIPG